MVAAIAKLSPPRAGRGTVQRTRLFECIDAALGECGCLWIGAAAGCGKTVLAASWARTRGRPLFWFAADDSDASAGNFLHDLQRLAQSASRRPAPRYAPDGRVPLLVLVRAFVRAFHERLPRGAVLVVDDAERIAPSTEGMLVIAELIAQAPPGVDVLVLSRHAPDASLARAQVSGRLAVLDAGALRLSPHETRQLAHAHGRDCAAADHIHACSGGWAAGARLLAQRGPSAPFGHDWRPHGHEALFAYIANELFGAWPVATREVLLRIAQLPAVSAATAVEISGRAEAVQVLEELARDDLFLARLPGTPCRYRLHPLLREFLQAAAADAWTPEELAGVRRRSASALAAAGDVAAAARQWIALLEWGSLVQLLEAEGDKLLADGRHGEVLAWLAALPAAEQAARAALLGLWRARALLATAPAEGVQLLVTLWPALESSAEPRRLADAWEAVVCSHLFLRRPQRMADWEGAAERLAARMEAQDDAALRRRVLAASFIGFSKIAPDRWISGELAAIEVAADPRTPADLRLTFGASLHYHSLWHAGARPLPPAFVQDLRALVRRGEGSVHQRLVWCWIDAVMQVWFEPDESLPCVQELVALGRALQDEHGIHEFGFVHFVPIQVAAHQGRPEAAAAHVAALRALPPPPHHALFEMVPRVLPLVLHELAQGNPSAAREKAREATQAADTVGSPPQRMLARCTLARTFAARGELIGAYRELRTAASIGRQHGVTAWSCAPWLTAAVLALDAGRQHGAAGFARRAFAVLARHAVWRPPQGAVKDRAEFVQLCALAWRYGIEHEWVRTLVRGRALEAPPDAGASGWPWPVRIMTSASLRIERDGQPLVFGRKAPRKVLQLLQLVVAGGRRGIAVADATDALWPDDDGDAAHRAFLMSLYRLRKLLGDFAVIHREGHLRLDAAYVYVEGTPEPARAVHAAQAERGIRDQSVIAPP